MKHRKKKKRFKKKKAFRLLSTYFSLRNSDLRNFWGITYPHFVNNNEINCWLCLTLTTIALKYKYTPKYLSQKIIVSRAILSAILNFISFRMHAGKYSLSLSLSPVFSGRRMLLTSTRKATITGSGKLVSFSQRTLWIDVFILPTYYLKNSQWQYV